MAKALPLKYAAKLARRVNAYYRACLQDGTRPTLNGITDPMERQETMLAHVQAFLDVMVKRDGSPWRADLDDTMFYL